MIIKLPCVDSYVVGDVKITRVEVNPISFMDFVALSSNVQRAVQNDEAAYSKRMFRARIKQQVKAFNEAAPVEWGDMLIGMMPIRLALQLRNAISDANIEETDGTPQIINRGDGISTPVLIKLGRPINMGEKKTPLAELEIKATTLDQLEDAILAENKLEQVAAVLKVAKPVADDNTLQALPSWALSQISLHDGLWMMSTVLPSFFGEAESS